MRTKAESPFTVKGLKPCQEKAFDFVPLPSAGQSRGGKCRGDLCSVLGCSQYTGGDGVSWVGGQVGQAFNLCVYKVCVYVYVCECTCIAHVYVNGDSALVS